MESELEVLRMVRQQDLHGTLANKPPPICKPSESLALQQKSLSLYMYESITHYIVQLELVMATQHPEHYIGDAADGASLIDFGASPRGTLA